MTAIAKEVSKHEVAEDRDDTRGGDRFGDVALRIAHLLGGSVRRLEADDREEDDRRHRDEPSAVGEQKQKRVARRRARAQIPCCRSFFLPRVILSGVETAERRRNQRVRERCCEDSPVLLAAEPGG